MADIEKLKQSMGELDEPTVLSILEQVIAEDGVQVQEAMEACQVGMNIVGDRFESGEYFVSDLIFAGDLMTQSMDILRPAIKGDIESKLGRMILCTVANDLHDIGKNIVKSVLEVAGFEVIDLGIDVKPDTIVEETIREGVSIVALSGVLTLALDSMKATIDAFKKAGIRDRIKIIIGGAPVSEDACEFTGADSWAHSPQTTVKTCRLWAENVD